MGVNSGTYTADLHLLLRPSRRSLQLGLLLSGLSAALDLVSLVLLPVVVKLALSAGRGLHQEPDGLALPLTILAVDDVLLALGAIMLVFVLRMGLAIFVGAYLARLTQTVREQVSRRLVSGYLNEPYAISTGRSVAEGITTAIAHTGNFAGAVVMPMLRLGVDLLTILSLLGFLAWMAPLATAMVALMLAATGTLYALVVRRSNEKHSRRVAQLEGVYSEQIAQALQGAREVRIYGAQEHYAHAISTTMYGLAHSQARLGAIYWLPRALGELALILIAIGYMAYTMLRGQTEGMVLSSLSALAFAGMRLLPAFAQSMVGVSMLRAGRAVTAILAEEIRQTTASIASIHPPESGGFMGPLVETIELENVRFGYTPESPILDDLHLTIRRGQSVGVIGRSGAGKSTLGDILLGLLEPQGGHIRINGELQTLTGPHWWNRVGFVPQTPHITNQSLARNIAYGLSDAEIDYDRLWHAIRLAQLEPLVLSWPAGVEARLGDQGVKLSGGQRQRVAIARALYREREFLVLDEATSALDQSTEAEVIQALAALRGKVTMLVVAHRLSTLDTCDLVIELVEGRARLVDLKA